MRPGLLPGQPTIMTAKPDTPDLLAEIHNVHSTADCVYSPAEVTAAVERWAQALTTRLHDRNPLFLIVMIGGAIPSGLLLPRLDFPLQVDYLHATRYTGATAGGTLTWLRRPLTDLTGRTVVILDDVLDEGVTLAAIAAECRTAGAELVLTAVLLEKAVQRPPNMAHADFVALHGDNRYLYGCGMDYKNYLRNAPGIYAVKNS
jgi:hypoxanthine phosphoribosyltransferase